MGGKHRFQKIKQEHTIIKGILPLLENIAKIRSVKSIIPGRINQRKGSGTPPFLSMKYNTPTGLKILGKNSSSIQEIFVVTDDSQKTIKFLKKKDFVK